MSDDNVDVLRNAYAAFARRDIDAVLSNLDENVEWTTPIMLPSGATYHGHRGVRAFLEGLSAAWERVAVEPEEFIDAGDTIVVVVRELSSGPGGSTLTRAVHIWRM